MNLTGDILPIVNTILGAINLAALLTIAFTGGRWMGRVETRLDHLEAQPWRRRSDRPDALRE